jgi:hypothetical protein
VLARLEQHLLEREAAGCLLVGTLGDPCTSGAHALDELIANVLELSQVQQTRLPARLAGGLIQATHREGGHEGVRELALESLDLRPEGPPGRPLAAVDDRRGNLLGDRRPAGDLFEQLH